MDAAVGSYDGLMALVAGSAGQFVGFVDSVRAAAGEGPDKSALQNELTDLMRQAAAADQLGWRDRNNIQVRLAFMLARVDLSKYMIQNAQGLLMAPVTFLSLLCRTIRGDASARGELLYLVASVATGKAIKVVDAKLSLPWHQKRILKPEGLRWLKAQGMSTEKATKWWNSGTGPRYLEELKRGSRYVRYAGASGEKGRGSFFTQRIFRSAQEAADALKMDKPKIIQFVEIVETDTPVYGMRSGISGGSDAASQIALPNSSVYRIVTERGIN